MRINHKQKKVVFKIVYYGTALSGKTTNLEVVFKNLKSENKISEVIKHTETDGDRTLFFDFLPVDFGILNKIGNYSVELSLFTVPGQSHYQSTRKKILEGADGIVLVADSQILLKEANLQSLYELKDFLKENNLDFETIPFVLQLNKRDLTNTLSNKELFNDLKRDENTQYFEASAINNFGVKETLTAISKECINSKLKKI